MPVSFDSVGADPRAELPNVFAQGACFIANATLMMEADQQEALLLPAVHAGDPEPADVWNDVHTLQYLQNPSADVMIFWTSAERRRVLRRASFYRWDGSVLLRKLADGSLRQCPKPESGHDVVKTAHESAGHFGRRRTTALVMLSYWWAGLYQDCRDVVRECAACSQSKVAFSSQQPVLNPLPVKGMFYRWGIDLAGPFPRSKFGHTYVMVCIESFTKYCEVFPLKDKSSAEVAYHFLHGVLARYGACAEVVTDGGGEFKDEFDELLVKAMVDHRVTSPNHPQANGLSERMVKTIKKGIECCVNSSGAADLWDLYVPWVAMGYRVTPQESTKLSPYQMMFACKPDLPSAHREKLQPA